jgi:hypothetical protein
MSRAFAFAIACIVVIATGAEGAARRKRAAPPQQTVQEQDEFKSCDVLVRDYIQARKDAAALLVKEVKVDELRMTMNFVHPYGESGETPPNLAFMRGESLEERRKILNETKEKMRTLTRAAAVGKVWYVIALSKDQSETPDAARSPANLPSGESRSSASAVVMADIQDKCISIAEFKSIPSERISEELRKLLAAPSSEQAAQ